MAYNVAPEVALNVQVNDPVDAGASVGPAVTWKHRYVGVVTVASENDVPFVLVPAAYVVALHVALVV